MCSHFNLLTKLAYAKLNMHQKHYLFFSMMTKKNLNRFFLFEKIVISHFAISHTPLLKYMNLFIISSNLQFSSCKFYSLYYLILSANRLPNGLGLHHKICLVHTLTLTLTFWSKPSIWFSSSSRILCTSLSAEEGKQTRQSRIRIQARHGHD